MDGSVETEVAKRYGETIHLHPRKETPNDFEDISLGIYVFMAHQGAIWKTRTESIGDSRSETPTQAPKGPTFGWYSRAKLTVICEQDSCSRHHVGQQGKVLQDGDRYDSVISLACGHFLHVAKKPADAPTMRGLGIEFLKGFYDVVSTGRPLIR
jgi:hypothetical protein